MSEENVGELEKEIPIEEPTEITPEGENPPEDNPEQTEGENLDQDDFSLLTEEELREKALRWKKTAENYKREIEVKGLRKKERVIEPVKSGAGETASKTDFLSKKSDVLDMFQSDISALDDQEWGKIKNLIPTALENVYQTARKENRFVARGELERTLKGLIDYAKSDKSRQKDLEEARLRGIREKEQFDDAEIQGTRVVKKPAITYSDEVQKLAKEKGWTPQRAQEILEARKKRQQEYAPKYRF